MYVLGPAFRLQEQRLYYPSRVLGLGFRKQSRLDLWSSGCRVEGRCSGRRMPPTGALIITNTMLGIPHLVIMV